MRRDARCFQRGPAWSARTAVLVGLVSVMSWAAPASAQPISNTPSLTNNTPPSISGIPEPGATLTEEAGSWSDATSVTVQWESCPNSLGSGCTVIPNSPTAQGSQYTPTTTEIGQWITVVETASDGQGNVGMATADPVGPVTFGTVTATMQWTFYYTPSYTKVLALTATGLSPGMPVVVRCHGEGCPFQVHTSDAPASNRCGQKHRAKCKPPGTLDLAPPFRGRRLLVGTQITVEIRSPGGLGKYYEFTVRAGRGPLVQITCLAPGATGPGSSC